MVVLVSLLKFPVLMRLSLNFCWLLCAVFIGQGAYGQTNRKEKLEQEKVRLMDEIQLANRILQETQQDRKNTVGTIETVQQKLKLRQSLIKTLDREIELMLEQEAELEREMDTLKVELARQKEAYANMIRQAYKSRSTISRLMFILSSDDFNQALRRAEYLKQYANFRKQQVAEIKANQEKMRQKAQALSAQKVRKEALRAQLTKEQKRLTNERLSQQEAIAEYQSVEKNLRAKLRKKQRQARKVEKDIQRIIAAEIKRAEADAVRNRYEKTAIDLGLERGRDFTSNTSLSRLKNLISARRSALAKADAKTETTPKPTAEEPEEDFALSPKATQLAANFAANQKRLPWPVERGLVVSKFGTQRHPVVKSVIIENNGIDIAAPKGTSVTAVFDGEVSRVILLPDGYRAVLVNHGNYFSVYQNLTQVSVTQGQNLKKGAAIGVIATNPTTNETRLHFEVWNNSQAMNPLSWLASK
jgi:septal ring factor EnvC (AmiA/AmiB activator)